MQVSVIIPVFNAERFIVRAVSSALDQPETGEVLLIDDGSTDESAAICQQLAAQNEKVKFFQHPDNRNHGPGATRNIGLKKASCEFIAFLDADDYYVKNRFSKTRCIFESQKDIEGVYEKVDRISSDKKMSVDKEFDKIAYSYGRKKRIPSKQLFEYLVRSKNGTISLNGLTIKKNVLAVVGCMDQTLIQGEDTDLIWRLALKCNLVPGHQEKAICMSELHGDNITLRKNEVRSMKFFFYRKWTLKMLKNNWAKEINRSILNSFFYYHPAMNQFKEVQFFRILIKLFLIMGLFILKPKLIFKIL